MCSMGDSPLSGNNIYIWKNVYVFSDPQNKDIGLLNAQAGQTNYNELLKRCCTSLQQQIYSGGSFWLFYSALTNHYAESFLNIFQPIFAVATIPL